MDRQPVESSAVNSVGYDPTAEILEVEYSSGAVYRYGGVPREVFEWLLAAPSIGQFVNAVVKQYPYARDEG